MENQLTKEVYEQRCRDVRENLKVIRENIAIAAHKSGRNPEDITLLAATKTVPAEIINYAIHEEGLTHIGENRVQELCGKFDALDLQQCHCEFIGHLQTNKVRQLMDKVDRIQSVDSVKLAREISRQCELRNRTMNILVEVNIGGEAAKSGVAPEQLEELVFEIAQFQNLNIQGLMTIPPNSPDENEVQQFFTKIYQYFIDIKAKKLDNVSMDLLSMGMSADYALAIACGSNLVRVGSSIFGKRDYH